MTNTIALAGCAAQDDDRFVVRYRGQYPSFYIARTLPLAVLFLLFAGLYLDEESRRFIFSRQSGLHKPFSWLEFGFLLALAAAPLVDLALTLLRVRRGAIALAVSRDGIAGPVCHVTRLLNWSEIADVAVEGKFFVVRRQSGSLIRKVFARRGVGDINIAADHLDQAVDDILVAARRFAPLAPRRTAAS